MSQPVTLKTLKAMKHSGEKIACLTAYDASFSALLNGSGVDVVLVGDSLGMVIQGESSTVPVTMDNMIYHSRSVARGNNRALLMVDMPFMSFGTPNEALINATRLMQEGYAHMVKLEGGAIQLETVRYLTQRDVPVCAHIGLQPQAIHKLGGYKVQGRLSQQADEMLASAKQLEEAGTDVLLLECVPATLAATISASLTIPVIGIGAGVDCDGQILVLYDVLGITPGKTPRFSKNFLQGKGSVEEAVQSYVAAVKDSAFPAKSHIFS